MHRIRASRARCDILPAFVTIRSPIWIAYFTASKQASSVMQKNSNKFGVRARLTRQHLHKSKGKMMQTLYHSTIKGVTFGAPQLMAAASAGAWCMHARTHARTRGQATVRRGSSAFAAGASWPQGRRHRRPITPRGCMPRAARSPSWTVRCRRAAARRPPRRALHDVAELAPELRADAATQPPNLTARVPAEAETG